MPDECAGPSRIARPGPWLAVAAVWLVALLLTPAFDVVDRADPVAALALVGFATAAVAAVLSSAIPDRVPGWLGPIALGAMSFLVVATTVGFGQAWWGTWVVFAASAGGAYRGRGSALVVLAVPLSASLVLWGTGAGGSDIGTLAVTVFLAGAANLVLVRFLVTIGELRDAQRELAARTVVEERERFSRDLHDLLGRPLPPAEEEALAWVVREGVTNVVRHSGAHACRLRSVAPGDRERVVRHPLRLRRQREVVAVHRGQHVVVV